MFFLSYSPQDTLTSAFDPNKNFTEINDVIPIKFI